MTKIIWKKRMKKQNIEENDKNNKMAQNEQDGKRKIEKDKSIKIE